MSALLLPAWVALAFILGAIPFGVVIAKLGKGIDPRRAGSGNPGATNVARLCGLPFGILTLACDLLKGALPVWTALHLDPSALFHSSVALAAVAGHIKSPFLGFHGGHHHRSSAASGLLASGRGGAVLPGGHCRHQLRFPGFADPDHDPGDLLPAVRSLGSAAPGPDSHGDHLLDPSIQYPPPGSGRGKKLAQASRRVAVRIRAPHKSGRMTMPHRIAVTGRCAI